MNSMSTYGWYTLSAVWALLIFRLTTAPQVVVTEDTWFQQVMMSGAHFFFFGMQAVFLWRSIANKTSAVLTASLYGLAIELIQRSVPGRSADPIDWLLDTLGAVLFVIAYAKYSRKNG